MKLFNNTFNHLAQGLDYASTKNKVIANNIANVDTPNYKAKKYLSNHNSNKNKRNWKR